MIYRGSKFLKNLVSYVTILTTLLCIFYSLILIDKLQSQPLESSQIKSDPHYVWGEAEAAKREKARHQAEYNLMTKIQVSMNISITDIQSEHMDSTEIVQKMYTGMTLRGLQRIYKKQNPKWDVLAYIHEDSLKASFHSRRKKILSYVATGYTLLEQDKIGDALRNFYWAYLLMRAYPYDLTGQGIPGIENKIHLQVLLQNIINRILQTISVQAEKCYKEGNVAIAPLRFIYKEQPIRHLNFVYYSGQGNEYVPLDATDNGSIDIPLYDTPTSRIRKLTLIVEYAYKSEMENDDSIKQLNDIFTSTSFNNLKNVTLVFPWIPPPAEAKKESPPSPIVPKTEALEVLYGNRYDTNRFLEVLEQYKKLGILKYGQRKKFGTGKGCYVAVANNSSVADILYFNGKEYIEVKSNNKYKNLHNTFSGKRVIWIREEQ